MKLKLRICFWLSTLIVLQLAGSTTAVGQAPRSRFERLTVEDGLSNSQIMFILQDQADYMWFGSQDGLNKYDGYEVTVFRHDGEDPSSIGSNIIMSGLAADDGSLWFGTDPGGLNR
jgi:two-component system sensor histidine kinase ChiS